MPVRIDVASSDGEVINRHFGAAEQFLIFDVGENSIIYTSKRRNEPPYDLGGHSDEKLAETIELISDCKILLVSRSIQFLA